MSTPNSIRHTVLMGYSVKYFDLREPTPREPKFKIMVYDSDMLKALELLGQNVTDHIEGRFAKGGYKVVEIKKAGSTTVKIDMEKAYFDEMKKLEASF